MKFSTVFAIGLLIGALVGLSIGINIGKNRPLLSNPLEADAGGAVQELPVVSRPA